MTKSERNDFINRMEMRILTILCIALASIQSFASAYLEQGNPRWPKITIQNGTTDEDASELFSLMTAKVEFFFQSNGELGERKLFLFERDFDNALRLECVRTKNQPMTTVCHLALRETYSTPIRYEGSNFYWYIRHSPEFLDPTGTMFVFRQFDVDYKVAIDVFESSEKNLRIRVKRPNSVWPDNPPYTFCIQLGQPKESICAE